MVVATEVPTVTPSPPPTLPPTPQPTPEPSIGCDTFTTIPTSCDNTGEGYVELKGTTEGATDRIGAESPEVLFKFRADTPRRITVTSCHDHGKTEFIPYLRLYHDCPYWYARWCRVAMEVGAENDHLLTLPC